MTSLGFKAFIQYLIQYTQLNTAQKAALVTPECLSAWQQAFTHKSADPDVNYEVFEQLGDITFNKSLVWYFHRKYSVLNNEMGVKVVARLRIVYGSRKFLAALAQRYKFPAWIRLSTKKTSAGKLEAVYEDVFEAFIGALEYLVDVHIQPGLGYISANNFITHALNESVIDFAYENLFDAKTRLKEVVDMHNSKLTQLKYTVFGGVLSIHVCAGSAGKSVTLATEKVFGKQAEAEQLASETAIRCLESMGYSKPVPEEYRRCVMKLQGSSSI